MLGALILGGIGCALMRNPPQRRRRKAKQRNPRDTIHAASRLGKPTAKSQTACGMPLLEVFDYSPFAEEATCPACRAAAKADPNWWRPNRKNPLRRGRGRQVISGNIRRLMREGRPQRQAVAIALRTAKVPKRRNPVVSVKRSKEFKDFGTYDVALSDGTTVQISRDGGSSGNGWWYIEWPRLHHSERFLAFTKAEALASVEQKVAVMRRDHPLKTNPRRGRKRRR